jgi:hypothetical protein
MAGDESPVFELIEKLEAVKGVDIQHTVSEHD